MSLMNNVKTKGISVPITKANMVLFALIGFSIIVKYKYVYGMDGIWWDKVFIGFTVSFVITIIKNMMGLNKR